MSFIAHTLTPLASIELCFYLRDFSHGFRPFSPSYRGWFQCLPGGLCREQFNDMQVVYHSHTARAQRGCSSSRTPLGSCALHFSHVHTARCHGLHFELDAIDANMMASLHAKHVRSCSRTSALTHPSRISFIAQCDRCLMRGAIAGPHIVHAPSQRIRVRINSKSYMQSQHARARGTCKRLGTSWGRDRSMHASLQRRRTERNHASAAMPDAIWKTYI